MNITERFSLVDFLAYLFPGLVDVIGIAVLLGAPFFNLDLTIIKSVVNSEHVSWLAAGFLVCCYIIGALLSGGVEICLERLNFRKNILLKSAIPPKYFSENTANEIAKAFSRTFNIPTKSSDWSMAHFFLCRSLVMEYMPNAARIIQRQNVHRQLRVNLIPSITIWFIAGMAWSVQSFIGGHIPYGIFIAGGSTIAFTFLFLSLINKMNDNESRESRETLSAFLSGVVGGAFDSEIRNRFGRS